MTIPKRLRDRLGIRPGVVLEFHEEEGKLVASKVARRDPVDEVYGIVRLRRTTDEIVAELRGDPDAT